MKKILNPLLAAIIVAGSLVVLSGCNTVRGAGEDIQHGGAAISNEAAKHS